MAMMKKSPSSASRRAHGEYGRVKQAQERLDRKVMEFQGSDLEASRPRMPVPVPPQRPKGLKSKGFAKGGMVDQSMCSPRKQMAMGKKGK